MGSIIRRLLKSIMGKNFRCPDEEQCLELIRLMLDEQSTEKESKYIMKHINICFRCYDNYELENAIRKILMEKTERVEVSEQMVADIVDKLGLKSKN